MELEGKQLENIEKGWLNCELFKSVGRFGGNG